jgi:hypothetical protein
MTHIDMTAHGRFRRIGLVIRWCIGVCSLAFLGFLMADFLTRDGGALRIAASGLALVLVMLMAWRGRGAELARQRLFLVSLGLVAALAIAEVCVRVFAPFPIILRGGRINLPVNARTVVSGHGVEGLDAEITVSFNGLGFRGPEPPADWASHLTILCVGGSTTLCPYLSDGRTWPDRLSEKLSADFTGVWVNNAGLDGHSTFGHLHLVDQYISVIRPRVVLLFVGINDVNRDDLSEFDQASRRTDGYEGETTAHAIHRLLLQHSDLYALADNVRRHRMAESLGLTHQVGIAHTGFQHIKHIVLSDDERSQILREKDGKSLASYRQRLTELITRCHNLGIRVVLITQPVLYGEGTDDVRGINLETVAIGGTDGWTQWRLLQQYNAATTEVGNKLAVPVIAAADRMPKSSRYYYDFMHCNNDGAERLATLIDDELAPILSQWFPEFSKPNGG